MKSTVLRYGCYQHTMVNIHIYTYYARCVLYRVERRSVVFAQDFFLDWRRNDSETLLGQP